MSKELQEEIKLSQVLNINLAETLAHMQEKKLKLCAQFMNSFLRFTKLCAQLTNLFPRFTKLCA